MKNSLKGRNIILGVTGSIAAYKACDIVSSMVKNGISVNVVMTRYACEFITPLTLQSLSANRVYTEMFDTGIWQPEHIALADKAELILVAPASADIIAKLACGIADELLSSVILAFDKPVLVAPAMNDKMYNNSVTQDNIKKLKARGFIFIPPAQGRLASGTTGIGRLAAPALIVNKVEELLLKKNH